MSETVTVGEFLDLAVRSGLVSAETVAPYRDATDERLGQRIVNDGLLTRFQVKQLQQRRHRGFFIGTKYKILDLLGKGGMSRVLLCEHLMLQRLVAVKVMDPALEKIPGAADRFVREARAAAAVDHPHVARLYDVDRTSQGLYMVMEYIDGVNLQELVAWHGALSPARVAHYGRQAAEGLEQAHRAGLVHRDIKPGNLMINREGIVKVLDLGLARFYNTTSNDCLTTTFDPDAVLGTADFIAPEQVIDSRNADIRADIYSLGCTLYFLLLRKLPTDDGTTLQKLLWHQTKEAMPIRSVNPDIPEELAAVVEKMMRKDPAERYQTPAEVCDALAPFVTEPIAPPSTEELPRPRLEGYRSGRFSVAAPATPAGSTRQTATSTAIPTDVVRKKQTSPAAASDKLKQAAPSNYQVEVSSLESLSSIAVVSDSPITSATMRFKRHRRLVLWSLVGSALVVTVTIAGLLLPGRGSSSGNARIAAKDGSFGSVVHRPAAALRGGGSTFARPIMDHWAGLYEKSQGRRIEYVAQGSSKGVEALLSRFLDFACSDAPLSDKQMQDAKSNGSAGVQHIPLVMGAVVPTFNLAGENGQRLPLRFTGPLLANIFLGKVSKWNDPALVANNPGVKLPDLPIKVVYRQDGSGTTHIWTDYLSKASSAWKSQAGVGSKVAWPVGVGAEKNNGVADTVSRTTGAIGYVELSYAIANDLPVGIVQNRAGHYIKATEESISAAAVGALQTIPEDLRYSLTDAPGADAYPIVGTTWALLHLDQPPEKQQELTAFLKWATGDGQKHVTDLHYGRLPPEFIPKIHAALQKIR